MQICLPCCLTSRIACKYLLGILLEERLAGNVVVNCIAHPSLKQVCVKRYTDTPAAAREAHKTLADYFKESQPVRNADGSPNQRRLREIPFHEVHTHTDT